MSPDIVLDTNVLVAGVRSRRGRAFEVLSLVGTGRFTIHVSVPLMIEYEAALRQQTTASPAVIDAMLDYHCAVGQRHRIFFLWRPYLADPKDDMVLEVAVTGQCEYIVTYNTRDFAGSERFGLQALTPDAFLTQIGALS